jgi:hypothetical protein
MARPACTIVSAGQQVCDECDEYVVRRLLWVVVVLVVVTSITYVVLIVMLCHDPAVTSAGKTPTRSRRSASSLLQFGIHGSLLAGMRSPTAVQPNVPDTEARESATILISAADDPHRRPTARSHPNKGIALWTVDASSNPTTTSVCAGQGRCGAPRRNRTGDPILTMEPPGTAVRTGVSPAQARPSGPKLSVHSTRSYGFSC